MPTTLVNEPISHHVAGGPAANGTSQGLLSIQEVCGRLNLSRTTIWRLMNQHGLKFIRIGGARRIRERDLELWLEKHTVSVNPVSSPTRK